MKLVVGLGNPGKEYEFTRHNAGFIILDNFLEHIGNPIMHEKFNGIYYEYFYNNEKIIFLKPQKYINLSGEVIKDFVNYYKINIEDILIINDDMDILIGNYKLKSSGSSAGHNGLKNIEQELKTNEYKRLKIGISRNKEITTTDYVLGKFSKEEFDKLNEVVKESVFILEDYLNMSFLDLMNKYNKKN